MSRLESNDHLPGAPIDSRRLQDGSVLWIIAIGLFAYGIFCIAEAKYRKAA